ncbi:MAG: hypothetical protein NTU95_00710 [Methanothrix sp.]|nr:hypothetical protein [Methanothrix sp.]
MVDIAVISGSKSDQAIVDKIVAKLEEKGASFEHKVFYQLFKCRPEFLWPAWASIMEKMRRY